MIQNKQIRIENSEATGKFVVTVLCTIIDTHLFDTLYDSLG